MTNNKDLKTIQQQFKEQLNTPKTETRIILNDWEQSVKKSNLSLAVRSKVVNNGSYLSSRATITNPSYGPGVDGAETKYCAASGCYEKIDESLTYCSKHSQVSSSTTTSVANSFADRAAKHGGEVEVKEESLKGETKSGTKYEYKSTSVTYKKNN